MRLPLLPGLYSALRRLRAHLGPRFHEKGMPVAVEYSDPTSAKLNDSGRAPTKWSGVDQIGALNVRLPADKQIDDRVNELAVSSSRLNDSLGSLPRSSVWESTNAHDGTHGVYFGISAKVSAGI
jgi:hypothetical protein